MDADLKAVIKEINKKHGQDTVILGSDVTQRMPRFPTGSLGLDAILGGGWPGNTWSELVGESSHGKALDTDTPIPTPKGWTSMGEISVGDSVFDEEGNPCTVTFATGVQHGRPCYEVLFSDGSTIVADADHRWWVHRKDSGGRRSSTPVVVTTEEMLSAGVRVRGEYRRFHVPLTSPVSYPSQELPIDPYILGLWLGDGSSASARFSVGDQDLEEFRTQVTKSGYYVLGEHRYRGRTAWEVTVSSRAHSSKGGRKEDRDQSLCAQLRIHGFLNNKHIPSAYRIGDVGQRLALLQGLMDSDGSVSRGQHEFTSTRWGLAEGVREVLSSLGIKSSLVTDNALLEGRVIGPRYRVLFYTDLSVFRFQRKAEGAQASGRSMKYRAVESITPVSSRPVRCITVDSPNHVYLAGHQYIPTHNTAVAFKTLAANQDANPDFTAVWVAAEEFVPEYAEMCGVDLSRLVLVETNIMEHAFDSVLKFASSRTVDGIILDSLPALVPLPEDEADMDKASVGRGALVTNKFFRKIGSSMKRSLTEADRPIFGLVINQYRMKIGVMHGDPRTTVGGEGKNYSYFSRVEVKRDGWIEVGKGDQKRKVGQSIRLRTTKNKTAPSQQTAFVDFYFGPGGDCLPGDYDFGRELVNLAHHYDILDRSGSWFSFAGQKWQGAEAVADAIRQDIDLREAMDKEVRDVLYRL